MSSLEGVNLSDVQEISVASHSGAASIAAKVMQVMRKVGYVQKDGKNEFQGYKYASEANAIAAIRPALVEAGLFMIPSVESVSQDPHGNTNVLVIYRIFDEEGHFISFRAAGSGNDKNSKGVGDKGIYKALTGASKYALLKTFMLETGDDPEVATEQDKEAKQETKPEPKVEKPEPRAPHPDTQKNEKEEVIPSGWDSFSFIECARSCTAVNELTELWSANQSVLNLLKKQDPKQYQEIVDVFKYCKNQL